MKKILLAIALLAAASAASAQTDVPTAPTFLEQVGATVTFRAGVWSSTHELDPDGPLGAGMLWAKVSRPVSEHVSLFADGWMALRGPFDRGRARGDWREAFVTVT